MKTKNVPLLLLTVLLVDLPVTAQESESIAMHTVPANIAPHDAPAQPLPFSHKTHLASGLVCQICHVNPDPGTLMTFPTTEACMLCHVTIAADSPTIVKLQEYADSGVQIPWVRVYAITPGVTWSHRAHMNADAQCETCHGDMSQSDIVAESKAILSMASCISCHQAHEAPAECVTCHAWPTDKMLGLE